MSDEISFQTSALDTSALDAVPGGVEQATQMLPAVQDEQETDAFADDLSKELEAAAAKTWHNRTTVVLGALGLVVAGFLGGVLVQAHFGKSGTTAASAAGFPNGFSGAGGFGGSGRGRGAGTAAAGSGPEQTGAVKLIDGTTIYVQLASGDVLTVRTSNATKVSLTSSAKVSSLKKGQQVTVIGTVDASTGTVTATSVTAVK